MADLTPPWRTYFKKGSWLVVCAIAMILPDVCGQDGAEQGDNHSLESGMQEVRNMSKSELLRFAEPVIRRGFVPPFLGRVLYGQDEAATKMPLAETIDGWGRDLPAFQVEMSRDTEGEVTDSDVRWFYTRQGRDDFAEILLKYGLSAALRQGEADGLAILGPNRRDWEAQNGSLHPQESNRSTPLYGIGYGAARRVSVPLVAAPRLANDAVGMLRRVHAAFEKGDAVRGEELVLDFFRAHGTHYLPGPYFFGGLVFATSLDPPSDLDHQGVDVRLRVKKQVHGGLHKVLGKHGVRIPLEEADDFMEYENNVETLVGNFTRVAGGNETVPEGLRWVDSVAWATTPSSTWEVYDRGIPIPIWKLVSKSRDPYLGGWLTQILQDTYARLLRQANGDVLHNVALAGGRPEIRFLVSSGVDVHGLDADGKTPLQVAVEASNSDTVRQLLQSGASVRMPPKTGPPLLHIAAELGNLEIVELLLRAGVDVSARDADGKTAVEAAKRASRMEIVDLLHRYAREQKKEL